MKKQLRWIAAGLCLSAIIPYVITLLWTGQIEVPKGQFEYSGRIIVTEGEELDLEEFLVRVVAAQIPADFQPAAIEAQAILSRTYLYKAMNGEDRTTAGELGIVYTKEKDIKKEDLKIYREAVMASSGKTIKCDGEYIEPMFHRASVERTRPGDESHPYLVSVESNDIEADGYLTITAWDKKTLADTIGGIRGDKTLQADTILENIQIIEREQSGYINTLQIGSNVYTGEEIAAKLRLNSTCFSFENYEGKIRIVTKGIGHGFGLSQWGANRLAASGKSADDIISLFFQNIQMVTE